MHSLAKSIFETQIKDTRLREALAASFCDQLQFCVKSFSKSFKQKIPVLPSAVKAVDFSHSQMEETFRRFTVLK
jgi:hypothetical protein